MFEVMLDNSISDIRFLLINFIQMLPRYESLARAFPEYFGSRIVILPCSLAV